MTTDESKHRRNADTLLDHADDMVEGKDHLQASEKIWGAVAHTLKQIAEKHGWENESNTDLARIAGYLTVVTGDREIDEGFRDAESFHANFYEDEFELDQIERGVRKAEETVKRLLKAGVEVDEGVLPSNGATSPADYYARLRHDDANTTRGALRQQGLTDYESGIASRIISAAKPPLVDDISFKIGSRRRRVTLGSDGRPKVGRSTVPKAKALEVDELIAEIPQPRRTRSTRYWPR